MKEFNTEKELAESYDRIWTDFVLKEERKYYSWIADLLDIQEGNYFLDVACGGGFMLREAVDRRAKTFGIDISGVAVKLAQRESPQSQIGVESGEHLSFPDNFFDYVTCLGSLEHYLCPEKGVKEISRVLKKDGRACIVLPNKWYWFDCLRGMKSGAELFHGQELERFYSKESACSLLEENGLIMTKILGYNNKIFLSRKWKPFVFLYDNWLRYIIHPNASYQFVFMCKKASK